MAAGAAGSILGTLAAGYLFISWVGATGTVLAVAALYAILAIGFWKLAFDWYVAKTALKITGGQAAFRDGGFDAVGDFLGGPPLDHGSGFHGGRRVIARVHYRAFEIVVIPAFRTCDRLAGRASLMRDHPVGVNAARRPHPMGPLIRQPPR